jgi:hypothetical protein
MYHRMRFHVGDLVTTRQVGSALAIVSYVHVLRYEAMWTFLLAVVEAMLDDEEGDD